MLPDWRVAAPNPLGPGVSNECRPLWRTRQRARMSALVYQTIEGALIPSMHSRLAEEVP